MEKSSLLNDLAYSNRSKMGIIRPYVNSSNQEHLYVLYLLLVISNKEIGEVCVHDFVLLLFDFGIGVIWREDEVYLPAETIDADYPVVTRVHLLLETLWVLNKLLM